MHVARDLPLRDSCLPLSWCLGPDNRDIVTLWLVTGAAVGWNRDGLIGKEFRSEDYRDLG
jgi:hypothetical protein